MNDDHIQINIEECYRQENGMKCFFCNINPGIIEEEGLLLCQDCFISQTEAIDNYYITKPVLHPDYNQITDTVYLGNEDTARDYDLLQKLNISHILICAKKCKKFFPNTFEYEMLDLDDSIEQEIVSSLSKAFQFIDSKTRNIYIHCVAGISRSASIVISYLMYKDKLSFKDAFDLVKGKRKRINPNSGFVKQLIELEEKLKK